MKDTFERFEQPDRGRFGDNESAPSRKAPRVTGASDLVDLTLQLRFEKPLSVAVTDPAKPQKQEWTWLPKSQIEFEKKGGVAVVVTLPEWLARSKGLV